MKFIYDHSVMMHVKFHEDVIGCRESIAFHCLNINEFGAKYMNIYSDAHEYSSECPLINRSYCLNFNEKNSNNFGGDINSISNLLVYFLKASR